MDPHYFFYLGGIFFFFVGAIIGSFLNVVIYRLGTGRPPTGRSACLSCGRTLSSLDLVPIFSFLALVGRCRYCKSRISVQYPLVELLSALLFMFLFFHYEKFLRNLSLVAVGEFGLSLIIASILIVIFVYDVRHKIIPDLLVYSFILLGGLIALIRFKNTFSLGFPFFSYLDLSAGFLFFLFFYFLWKISDGRWLGLGDGKLSLGIGLTLGFSQGLSSLVIGFWLGAIIGILLIALSRLLPLIRLKRGGIRITMKTEIPFAPFLLLGMAGVFFLKLNVFSLF